VQRQVHIATPNRFRHDGRRPYDVLNIGKAFCTQQLVGDILGCDADARVLDKADSRRFRRRILGNGIAEAKKRHCCGRRHRAKKAAPTLDHLHDMPPIRGDQISLLPPSTGPLLWKCERQALAKLELLNVAGFAVVRGLKMDVHGRVHGGEDTAMGSRMETNNDCVDLRELKNDLNLLMHLHTMGRISNAVEDMKLDEILLAADQERKRLLRIEAGRKGRARHERLQLGSRAHRGRNRHRLPSGNLGPDQEWRPRFEAAPWPVDRMRHMPRSRTGRNRP
jgi:hypothetical protein